MAATAAWRGTVKTKIMLGFLVVTLGSAFGMATLDGGPDPLCWPGVPCQIGTKTFDGGPDPICLPGRPCQLEQKNFDGGPEPICRPGIPCQTRK